MICSQCVRDFRTKHELIRAREKRDAALMAEATFSNVHQRRLLLLTICYIYHHHPFCVRISHFRSFCSLSSGANTWWGDIWIVLSHTQKEGHFVRTTCTSHVSCSVWVLENYKFSFRYLLSFFADFVWDTNGWFLYVTKFWLVSFLIFL